ncbi:dentin sialophosphoprotein isoform X2 [Teleopsis dalmanni]|uniref:dentin sialophosphoprotein isoform X2 n=1 Tax=Teleopsis dalmanni TaxID=139649 RepID=UPI0018CDAAC7|nr:dentin sialophosphoprotein isoform X2 [Teleopsis dalmanni]
MATNCELRDTVIQTANKHPNSKISKLIFSLHEEPTLGNIALLVTELAAQSTGDFDFLMSYFLDMFYDLILTSNEDVLNEAGLLIYNATKVISRAEDNIFERAGAQLNSLISNAGEADAAKANGNPTVEKPPARKTKRSKKIMAETENPFEMELSSKPIKPLTREKRFTDSQIEPTKRKSNMTSTPYTYPVVWQDVNIMDKDNTEDTDLKRNYKLFTYHIEHRYNTLVPDINFRIHFKVKDYIQKEKGLLSNQLKSPLRDFGNWQPLSEECVNKYLDLEDLTFEREITGQQNGEETREKLLELLDSAGNEVTAESTTAAETATSNTTTVIITDENNVQTSEVNRSLDATEGPNESNTDIADTTHEAETVNKENVDANSTSIYNTQESGFGDMTTESDSVLNSLVNENLDSSNISQNVSATNDCTDSGINSALDTTDTTNKTQSSNDCTNSEINNTLDTTNTTINNDSNVDLCSSVADASKISYNTQESGIDISFPDDANGENTETTNTQEVSENIDDDVHMDDDLENTDNVNLNEDQAVVPGVDSSAKNTAFPPNKENITITVDDSIKNLLNAPQVEPEVYNLPNKTTEPVQEIKLNIFKFKEKLIRKRVLFRLGPDFDLFIKARTLKRQRGENPAETRSTKLLKQALSRSPTWSLQLDSDFLGFEELPAIKTKERNFSKDSGTGTDLNISDDEFLDTEDNHLFRLETIEEVNEDLEMRETDLCSNELSSITVPTNPPINCDQNSGNDCALSGENNTTTMESIVDEPSTSDNHNANSTEPTVDMARGDNNASIAENTMNVPVQDKENNTSANDVTAAVESNNREENNECTTELTENIARATNADNNDVVMNELDNDVSDTEFINFDNMLEEDDNDDEDEDGDGDNVDDLVKKTRRWHKKLRPMLAEAHARSTFDVYELGTEIINKILEVESKNRVCTFQDIMEGKDWSYVARYILAALLLINQRNIDIIKDGQAVLEDRVFMSHEISFKLLTTKRHEVAIEDNIGMVGKTKQNIVQELPHKRIEPKPVKVLKALTPRTMEPSTSTPIPTKRILLEEEQ